MNEKINCKKLLVDVEKYGMPEIYFFEHGIYLSAKVDNIQIVDTDVVLSTGKMKLSLTHLGDNLRVTPGGRPANLIVKCRKCYDVLTDYNEISGICIYWKE